MLQRGTSLTHGLCSYNDPRSNVKYNDHNNHGYIATLTTHDLYNCTYHTFIIIPLIFIKKSRDSSQILPTMSTVLSTLVAEKVVWIIGLKVIYFTLFP